jgi:hypothetical protein
MSTVKSKELIKQQKIWYKKLKEDGFKDIEVFNSEMEPYPLTKGDVHAFACGVENKVNTEETEEFFRLAGHFLHEYSFETQEDKDMWEHFCNGLSYRKILKLYPNRTYYYIQKRLGVFKAEVRAQASKL